jgi:hypothetical protein
MHLKKKEKVLGDGHYQCFEHCLTSIPAISKEYNKKRFIIENAFGRLKDFNCLVLLFWHALEKHHVVWKVYVKITNMKIDH